MAGPRRTIDELVEQARTRLDRVEPHEVGDAVARGAVVLDIRSEFHRARDGVIPGSRFHPRSVLEWRMDPSSGHDDPELSGAPDRQVILVCHEGYSSSIAAATLQDLGFPRATDLVGGFTAWREAGLPIEPAP